MLQATGAVIVLRKLAVAGEAEALELAAMDEGVMEAAERLGVELSVQRGGNSHESSIVCHSRQTTLRRLCRLWELFVCVCPQFLLGLLV